MNEESKGVKTRYNLANDFLEQKRIKRFGSNPQVSPIGEEEMTAQKEYLINFSAAGMSVEEILSLKMQ